MNWQPGRNNPKPLHWIAFQRFTLKGILRQRNGVFLADSIRHLSGIVIIIAMERYIIPFEFNGKSHYVFIDKDDEREIYLVGKILPYAEAPYPREISFRAMAEADPVEMDPRSLESVICITLYRFLHARGWLAFSN